MVALPEDLQHFYFIAIHAYWVQELDFEAEVRERQKLCAQRDRVEMCSMPVSDWPKYCRVVPIF